MAQTFAGKAWNEIALNALRIVAGFLIMPHGAQKLFGALGREAVPLASLPGLPGSGILRRAGDPAGLLHPSGGLRAVRPDGRRLLAGPWDQGLLADSQSGELAALYCFVFLYLAAQGGGDWSIDGCISKRVAGSLVARIEGRAGMGSCRRIGRTHPGVHPPPHQPSPAGSASATPPQGGSDREACIRRSSITPPLRGSRREGAARSRAGGGQTPRPVGGKHRARWGANTAPGGGQTPRPVGGKHRAP